MTEFLNANHHNPNSSAWNPYTRNGAQRIVRKWHRDVMAMLTEMADDREVQPGGKTLLAQSPLRTMPWVAGAMKTLGWVDEGQTATGACALVLTDRGLRAWQNLQQQECAA